jgi:hypothetical protein
MNDVVFLSGWAGVPGLYPGLSGRVHFLTPFLDGDEAELIATVLASNATVLAGWSTGAHMICKHARELLPRFSRVVLAAPFVRFTDSFPARLIRSMLARMQRDPEGTSLDFWKACGFTDPTGWNPAWAAPLTEGLRYLLVSEAPAECVPAGNVTVLHGDADRIVRTPAMRSALSGLAGASLRAYSGGHSPDEAVLAAHLFP